MFISKWNICIEFPILFSPICVLWFGLLPHLVEQRNCFYRASKRPNLPPTASQFSGHRTVLNVTFEFFQVAVDIKSSYNFTERFCIYYHTVGSRFTKWHVYHTNITFVSQYLSWAKLILESKTTTITSTDLLRFWNSNLNFKY